MAGVLLVVFAVALRRIPRAAAAGDGQTAEAAEQVLHHHLSAARGGPWVRDGNLLINVAQQSGSGEFGGMRIFELTDGPPAQVGGHRERPPRVQPDGSWQLSHYRQSPRSAARPSNRDQQDSRDFNSSVGGDFLALTVSDPRQLETRVSLESHAAPEGERPGCQAEQEFAFWSRIARTAAILFAALLAVPFVFGSLRSAGSGARTLFGVLIGVVVLLHAAHARERRAGVRRQPAGARLVPDGAAGQRRRDADRPNALGARSQLGFLGAAAGSFSSSSSCFLKMRFVLVGRDFEFHALRACGSLSTVWSAASGAQRTARPWRRRGAGPELRGERRDRGCDGEGERMPSRPHGGR